MADVVEILLLLVSLPLFGFAVSIAIFAGYVRARRKGYEPMSAAVILLFGLAAAIELTLWRHPPNSTGYRFFIDFFWVPLLFAGAVIALVLSVLPRKRLRHFGPRAQFPFGAAGVVLIGMGVLICAGAVVSSVLGWAKSGHVVAHAATFVFGFVIPSGYYLIRRGRRTEAAPPLEKKLRGDSRAPVLYLRAFKQESQFFVMGRSQEYGAYAKAWHASVSSPAQRVGIPFEQFFCQMFEERLGPFVALGSPEDYLSPEGATRVYASDDDWKEKLDELALRASCIVLEIGKSENLQWEFEHLRAQGLEQKLFLFTPPKVEGDELSRAFWTVLWRMAGIQDVRWGTFRRELERLGYRLMQEDPGPGSVSTFGANGENLLLTTEAEFPDDFVEPIKAWLERKERVGRWVPVACARCGRATYDFPRPKQQGVICRRCRAGPSRRAIWKRVAPTVYALLALGLFLASIFALAMWAPRGSWVDRHIGGVGTLILFAIVGGSFWLVWRNEKKKEDQARETAETRVKTQAPNRNAARNQTK